MKICGICNHSIWSWQQLSIVALSPSGEAGEYIDAMATYTHDKCRKKKNVPLWENSEDDRFVHGFRYRK